MQFRDISLYALVQVISSSNVYNNLVKFVILERGYPNTLIHLLYLYNINIVMTLKKCSRNYN